MSPGPPMPDNGAPSAPRNPYLRFGDTTIAALLFVTLFVAAWLMLARTGVREFYEVYFSPAVNFACRGEFAELDRRSGCWRRF